MTPSQATPQALQGRLRMDPRASQVPLQSLPMPLQSIAAIIIDAAFVYYQLIGRKRVNEIVVRCVVRWVLSRHFNDASSIDKLPTRI